MLADSGRAAGGVHPRARRGRCRRRSPRPRGRARRPVRRRAARRYRRRCRWSPGRTSSAPGEPPRRCATRSPTDEDSWALWLYTSGTTGLPKAAMHRHANIRHVAETYGAQVLGIRPDDVTFSVAKLFFAYGIGNSVFFPLVGRRDDRARPAAADAPDGRSERLAADRPTLFFAVPTFYAALLASDLPDDAFAVGAAGRVGRRAAAGARCSGGSRTASASTSSTGSARPRRCTSSCPTDPATSVRGRPARRCPATTWRCATTTGGERADGGAGRPARPRRVDRPRLLAPYGRDPAGVPGRVAGHRRHLRPRRRRLLHLPGPQLRHAQGRWDLGLAGRGREPADRAPCGA